LTSVAEAKSREDARTSIPELLAKLGDPYTRWLPAKQYQDFRIGNDGQLQGVGMLIASDPQSGRLVVLAPIKGSPADQAGIQPGDEVSSSAAYSAACSASCLTAASPCAARLPACPRHCEKQQPQLLPHPLFHPRVALFSTPSAPLPALRCSW
jgi:hypothetical protein